MIIDFHTHIFPDKIAARSIEALSKVSGVKAATDGTLNGLLVSMERSGVDLSVILPVVTKPSQFESINTFAAKVNEKYNLALSKTLYKIVQKNPKGSSETKRAYEEILTIAQETQNLDYRKEINDIADKALVFTKGELTDEENN